MIILRLPASVPPISTRASFGGTPTEPVNSLSSLLNVIRDLTTSVALVNRVVNHLPDPEVRTTMIPSNLLFHIRVRPTQVIESA